VPGIARAFVAVVPPATVLDAIEHAVTPVRDAQSRLRWVRRDAWHVTLQFLGRVADADAVVAALATAARDPEPFPLRLGGAGAFPSPSRAAVLWAGVSEGAGPLVALAGAVGRATAPLGFAVDATPMHPHLTVARARPPRRVADAVAALDAAAWGPAWTVDEIVLVESDTRPSGAVHTEVARVRLRGP
jgi:2'-5' RNA ligase